MSDSIEALSDVSGEKKVVINVGTRNSKLALIQTDTVIKKLKQCLTPDWIKTHLQHAHPCFNGSQISYNTIGMTTLGDRILDKALPDIGSKSLFTKELEVALLDGQVDFIVHSLKDLPTTLPRGCVIGAVMKRDDPNDAIVLKKSLRTSVNPLDMIFGQNQSCNNAKFRIGTSSNRRIAMLRRCNAKLDCVNIRGNLNTRLDKLDRDDDEYSAIILAKAGLDRMGWTDRISMLLEPASDKRLSDWCYAVGQGAIAIECREGDKQIIDLLSCVSDLRTTYEVAAERSLMKTLEGGCSVPLGVRSNWNNDILTVLAAVLSKDGSRTVQASETIDIGTQPSAAQDLESSSTGIVCSDSSPDYTICKQKIEACSRMGHRLANKMIDAGCVEVMRGSA